MRGCAEPRPSGRADNPLWTPAEPDQEAAQRKHRQPGIDPVDVRRMRQEVQGRYRDGSETEDECFLQHGGTAHDRGFAYSRASYRTDRGPPLSCLTCGGDSRAVAQSEDASLMRTST